MSATLPDPDQLRRFVSATFRNAGEGGTVVLRGFFDDAQAKKRDERPYKTSFVRFNGAGFEPLIAAVAKLAQEAAEAERPVVICPPIATFNGMKADEKSLREGLTLSVELDGHAHISLLALRAILGTPTLVVASGGEWTDPETGEVEPKLHVHWRLKEPTRAPEEHARLKRARSLACELVGADATSKPIVHGMRWAGTLHRKDPHSTKLCRIIEENPEAEIAMEDALYELEGLAFLRSQAEAERGRRTAADPAGDTDVFGLRRADPER